MLNLRWVRVLTSSPPTVKWRDYLYRMRGYNSLSPLGGRLHYYFICMYYIVIILQYYHLYLLVHHLLVWSIHHSSTPSSTIPSTILWHPHSIMPVCSRWIILIKRSSGTKVRPRTCITSVDVVGPSLTPCELSSVRPVLQQWTGSSHSVTKDYFLGSQQ